MIRSNISAYAAIAITIVAAGSLQAQQRTAADRDSTHGFSWARVALSVRGGTLHTSGNSEAHRVVDHALTSGQAAFEPFVTGGSLQVPLSSWVAVHVGVDGGRRTTRSESRVRPLSESAPVQQRTRFALSSFVHAGLEATAWRWRQGATLAITAGAGRGAYTLQQDGRFVDVDRLAVFEDELSSRGHGTIGYVGVSLDVPVTHWASLRTELRQQRGTAAMSGDFAGFDRLDLGGTRVSLGVAVRPFARLQ